ncbi:hypothetical protein SAMN02745857_01136 [Andreprevotia lacus DSM 23236]|uniref:Tfp pilus assembly protein PilX n=1 Tax=Andreprevotia lacus DSM 23236 TaxID=1121001 RepID=A0A1W1XB37_9NEIS|nr:hypothetical protein [Andreprevotia lacus]SMC21132.1 hypothetical protein SAMN02745857_01136 [Andreprevotia lacus DSM 23236]
MMSNGPLTLRSMRTQQGIALFLALIALVVMTLAAIALVKSVDSGTLVIGNLSFKQAAVVAADHAAEDAVSWLQTNATGTTLDSNNTAAGYYATYLADLDPTGNSTKTGRVMVDWDNNNCNGYSGTCIDPVSTTTTSDGTTVSYLISRQCTLTGSVNATNQMCSRPGTSSSANNQARNSISYNEYSFNLSFSGPYYRIIVRAKGARNTVSYTETLMHM